MSVMDCQRSKQKLILPIHLTVIMFYLSHLYTVAGMSLTSGKVGEFDEDWKVATLQLGLLLQDFPSGISFQLSNQQCQCTFGI